MMTVPDVPADLADYIHLSNGRLDSELSLAPNDVLSLCSDGIPRILSADGVPVSPTEVSHILSRVDSDSHTGREDPVMRDNQQLKDTSKMEDEIVLPAIHRSNTNLPDSRVSGVRKTRVPA